jgi:hypothetical protein
VICGLRTIITGIFLGPKPTWNTYWTWIHAYGDDHRVGLPAYLLFCNAGSTSAHAHGLRRAVLLGVPLTFYNARLFRPIHPSSWQNADAQGAPAWAP